MQRWKPAKGSAAGGVPILAPQDAAFKQETVTFQVKPREGMEYKYRLEKGEALLYSWSSSVPMNTEFHAEPDGGPRGYAQTYEKKDGMTGASGTLTAPFAGIHGWYWENTTGQGRDGHADDRRLLQPRPRVPNGAGQK